MANSSYLGQGRKSALDKNQKEDIVDAVQNNPVESFAYVYDHNHGDVSYSTYNNWCNS